MTPVAVLRARDGMALRLDTDRWHGDATAAEMAVLDGVTGPAIDIGCGPGRFVLGLARRGVVALGIDPAPGAVQTARGRGACVLQRSVFDPLPGEGRWQSALLMDGNVGIGGDPVRLLSRCRALVAPGGTIVVELHPPGIGERHHRARLERGGVAGPWFEWAEVGVDAIGSIAAAAGVRVQRTDRIDCLASEGRWFARLIAPERLHGVA